MRHVLEFYSRIQRISIMPPNEPTACCWWGWGCCILKVLSTVVLTHHVLVASVLQWNYKGAMSHMLGSVWLSIEKKITLKLTFSTDLREYGYVLPFPFCQWWIDES